MADRRSGGRKGADLGAPGRPRPPPPRRRRTEARSSQAALSTDGSRFVTLARDETLRVWDIGRRSPFSRTVGGADADLLAARRRAMTGRMRSRVMLRGAYGSGTSAEAPRPRIAEGGAEIRSVALRCGSRIAAGDADGVDPRLASRTAARSGAPPTTKARCPASPSGPTTTGSFPPASTAPSASGLRTAGPMASPCRTGRRSDTRGRQHRRRARGCGGRRGTVRIWDVGSRRLRGEHRRPRQHHLGRRVQSRRLELATASDDEHVTIWECHDAEATRAAHRPRRRRDRCPVQPRRADAAHRQRQRASCGCGTSRPERLWATRSMGHEGVRLERRVAARRRAVPERRRRRHAPSSGTCSASIAPARSALPAFDAEMRASLPRRRRPPGGLHSVAGLRLPGGAGRDRGAATGHERTLAGAARASGHGPRLRRPAAPRPAGLHAHTWRSTSTKAA